MSMSRSDSARNEGSIIIPETASYFLFYAICNTSNLILVFEVFRISPTQRLAGYHQHMTNQVRQRVRYSYTNKGGRVPMTGNVP